MVIGSQRALLALPVNVVTCDIAENIVTAGHDGISSSNADGMRNNFVGAMNVITTNARRNSKRSPVVTCDSFTMNMGQEEEIR